MLPKLVFMTFVFVLFGNASEEKSIYTKDYYPTGKLKAEGWLKNGVKTDYWKFYHPNGKCSEQGHYRKGQRIAYWYFYDEKGRPMQEGHYKNDEKTNWWLFYDANGQVNHKCQLNNGKKNGYCLQYLNEKITSAEKYSDGKKIKEWYSFSSFKRDNSLSDLR